MLNSIYFQKAVWTMFELLKKIAETKGKFNSTLFQPYVENYVD